MTRRLFLAAAPVTVVLLILIVLAVTFVFVPCGSVEASSCDKEQQEGSETFTPNAVSSVPADPPRLIGSMGPLVRLEGDVITVRDGEGEHSFLVNADTKVTRGIGHRLVTDHDLRRIQPDDSLNVVGQANPTGLPVAMQITANGFIGRDGIVVGSGDAYFDVRLRSSRLATEFDDTATRIWTAPDATFGRPRTAGVPNSSDASVGDLTPGRHAAFQGFIADDGEYVAILVWFSD